MRHAPAITLVLAIPLLAACATGPRFDSARYDTAPTPQQAAEAPADHRGTSVMWGGVIISSRNTENGTLIEVLGYPLDSAQRPRTDRSPYGRFLVVESRFLEPVDYAQGRLLTVTGTLGGTREGKVGESTYVYPLLEAAALYLWPRDGRTTRPRFNIGVGVIFSR